MAGHGNQVIKKRMTDMKIVALLAMLAGVSLLTGCLALSVAKDVNHKGNGQYQIITTGQGIVKMNTQTGEAWRTDGQTWFKMEQK